MILFDRLARVGSWLILLFLVPLTFTVHGFEMMTADSAETHAIQLSFFFLKGLAMTCSALLISQLGAQEAAPAAAN